LSNAVDQALDKVCLQPFYGRAVFINDQYLDCVDKGYVMGSLRHRVLATGARLAKSADEADIVLEVRSGGIGTNHSEGFVGIPALGIPGFPVEFPEVKLLTQQTQSGLVKLGVVAYDAKTGLALGLGGTSIARANENNWYVLGVGPFQGGSTSDEVLAATGQNDSLIHSTLAADEVDLCRGSVCLVDDQGTHEPRIARGPSDSVVR
jgi:hypothetical protein